MNNSNWLANIFIKQREIIEAAETPFAKLAIFVLPILAPSVPAFITSTHMYKLFLEMFTFSNANILSFGMSFIIALVLELLGYVGAVSFIKSLFNWIRYKQDEYMLPFALNGLAYVFYLISMWAINVQLGRYFGASSIINNILGLLSFITVPTGLLAANHLTEVSDDERKEKVRQEQRQDRMDKYKIKHGIPIMQSAEKVQENAIYSAETLHIIESAGDWRKARRKMQNSTVQSIARMEISDIVQKYKVKERAAYNWRARAREEVDTESIE